MSGTSAKASQTTLQSKRAPKAGKGSAKDGAFFVSAPVEAVPEPGFASTAKPPKVKRYTKKIPVFQMDAGVSPCVAVPFISNPQSEGFAAKQMADDPAWVVLLHDLGTMSTMALRAKYAGEANTHRNMLQRVRTCGAVVHPSFRCFPDFLRLVGPKPTSRATLDRIDNGDPEYAPGKVRWADKTTQNRNKGDSLIFTCKKTGRNYTASQIASKQGVSPTAIRKRRRQGWTDAEIVAGQRETISLPHPIKTAPPTFRPRSMSAAQIMFERNRASCEYDRKKYGIEPFICTPKEMQEIMAEDDPKYLEEEWLRYVEDRFLRYKLPQYWKEYGPHIRFHALKPEYQAWVLKIDPAQGQKSELSDRL